MIVILIIIGIFLILSFIVLFLEIGENGKGKGNGLCNKCVFAPRCDGKNCNKHGDDEDALLKFLKGDE